ncbi:DUF3126 family protein [Lichenicoccus sp.]|uniref:DUF3126 family protein n=1 Tax=Lichenicoccus sp. TaxID=2781899 RepID=UPI003D0F2355
MPAVVNASEIARVQAYLRKLLGSDRIRVVKPVRAGMSVEVAVEEETIGTLHRDEDEGEVSYAMHVTILEEDLPAAAPVPGQPTKPTRR